MRIKALSNQEAPTWLTEYGDAEYPTKEPTVVETDDGMVLSWALH